MDRGKPYVGFSCAYTPVQMIDAAGFIPFKILPTGSCPEHAGGVLHDNLCPNVKRILDRGIAGDIPDLAGMVFMNSCDAMRRLSDAWSKRISGGRSVILDLPVSAGSRSAAYFRGELENLADILQAWSGHMITDSMISESIQKYNMLSDKIDLIRIRQREGKLKGGCSRLQEIFNAVATDDPETSIEKISSILSEEPLNAKSTRVPVYLFGNVLADPEAFRMFETAGAEIIADDLCTGSRMFHKIDMSSKGSAMQALGEGILNRPMCARTIFSRRPEKLVELLLERYRESGAEGIIFHTVKFCDPYLSRLPHIRKAVQEKGIPFLSLEGDCTIRSIGQQMTRIEAFIEMLR